MSHAQKQDFVFRRNRRVHLNRPGGDQFSCLLAAEVCASAVSNAGYTMFRGSVKSTGYPLHSPVSPSLPLPCVTVCHHNSTWLYSTLNRKKSVFSGVFISLTVRFWIKECFVLLIGINVRNLLPNGDRFFLVHPVYQEWLQRGSHELLSNNTLNLPSRTVHNVPLAHLADFPTRNISLPW
jgi:hypothetical protein